VRFCGPTALLARQATRDVQVNAADRVRRQTPLEVRRSVDGTYPAQRPFPPSLSPWVCGRSLRVDRHALCICTRRVMRSGSGVPQGYCAARPSRAAHRTNYLRVLQSPSGRPTDGPQIETGENILVAAHLANRDGRAFAEPDGFILDRDFDREPHIGKRCVASLACRMLFAVCCMLHAACCMLHVA
jgi:hypothetical protein